LASQEDREFLGSEEFTTLALHWSFPDVQEATAPAHRAKQFHIEIGRIFHLVAVELRTRQAVVAGQVC
jgi:hypothetical protein